MITTKHVISGHLCGGPGMETMAHRPYRGGKAGHYGITERVMDGEIRALPVSLHANKDGVSQHLFPLGGPFHCLDPNSHKTNGS